MEKDTKDPKETSKPSRFTQNYPTERKDYNASRTRDATEGDERVIDEAVSRMEDEGGEQKNEGDEMAA